jgi:hypothetical protein
LQVALTKIAQLSTAEAAKAAAAEAEKPERTDACLLQTLHDHCTDTNW